MPLKQLNHHEHLQKSAPFALDNSPQPDPMPVTVAILAKPLPRSGGNGRGNHPPLIRGGTGGGQSAENGNSGNWDHNDASCTGVSLSAAIDEYMLAIDGTISKRTIGTYKAALVRLLKHVGNRPIVEITPKHIRSWRKAMEKQTVRYKNHPLTPEKAGGLSVFTIRQRMTGARTFFHWCVRERLIVVTPFANVRIPPKPPRNQRKIKAITGVDFKRLLKAAADPAVINMDLRPLYTARDTALLWFLRSTNARAGGVAGLCVADLQLSEDWESGKATVTEKGNQTRTVYLTQSAANAVGQWLRVRPSCKCNKVFITLGGDNRGEAPHRSLTSKALGGILYRLSKRAGVTGASSPHAFRHAFAINATKAKVPLNITSKLMGHSSIGVTDEFYSVFSADDLERLYRESTAGWMT